MSHLLQGHKKLERQLFWFKFTGWLCLPCCGPCCCAVIGASVSEERKLLKQMVSFYTEDVLKKLGPMIQHQQNLFQQACMETNWTVQANEIYPKATLLHIVNCIDPKAGTIIQSQQGFHTINRITKTDEAYLFKVAKKYQELGGNYSTIIYGLAEYICTTVDPTSITATNMYKGILAQSQLNTLVQSHRAAAFSNHCGVAPPRVADY